MACGDPMYPCGHVVWPSDTGAVSEKCLICHPPTALYWKPDHFYRQAEAARAMQIGVDWAEGFTPIMQVHDEFILEVPDSIPISKQEAIKRVDELMKAHNIKVPFDIPIHAFPNPWENIPSEPVSARSLLQQLKDDLGHVKTGRMDSKTVKESNPPRADLPNWAHDKWQLLKLYAISQRTERAKVLLKRVPEASAVWSEELRRKISESEKQRKAEAFSYWDPYGDE